MQPAYSIHARRRMRKRGITEQNVEYVLSHAHTRFTDPDGHPVYIATIGERRLKVVVAPGTSPPVVITVIWLD